MSTAGLFMLLAIGVGVIAFVLWPVLFAGNAAQSASDGAIQTLQDEREAILETLRTLDFDYQTGKLVEDDYRVQRSRLVAHGAEILRQIDQLPAPKTNRKSRK
jgi:hypothetical protein